MTPLGEVKKGRFEKFIRTDNKYREGELPYGKR